LRALDTNRLAIRSKESIVYAYEDAAIDERISLSTGCSLKPP
jgi:hypothetical protein